MRTTAAITAVQGYLPDFVLSNQVLETLVDTNDAWITERTGIKERRILKGKDQGLSVMCVEAVKGLDRAQALESAIDARLMQREAARLPQAARSSI